LHKGRGHVGTTWEIIDSSHSHVRYSPLSQHKTPPHLLVHRLLVAPLPSQRHRITNARRPQEKEGGKRREVEEMKRCVGGLELESARIQSLKESRAPDSLISAFLLGMELRTACVVGTLLIEFSREACLQGFASRISEGTPLNAISWYKLTGVPRQNPGSTTGTCRRLLLP
jgi:hypothetical protein